MNNKIGNGKIACPECGKILNISNCEATEIVECPDCGVELEVVIVKGIKSLKILELEGEDQ